MCFSYFYHSIVINQFNVWIVIKIELNTLLFIYLLTWQIQLCMTFFLFLYSVQISLQCVDPLMIIVMLSFIKRLCKSVRYTLSSSSTLSPRITVFTPRGMIGILSTLLHIKTFHLKTHLLAWIILIWSNNINNKRRFLINILLISVCWSRCDLLAFFLFCFCLHSALLWGFTLSAKVRSFAPFSAARTFFPRLIVTI